MADISKIQAPDGTLLDLISKKTNGVIRCETDSTSTSTAFKVTVAGITELYNGLTLAVKNTVVASASGCTLQVNNLTARRIQRSDRVTWVTTQWALNSEYIFVYDEPNTRWIMNVGLLDGNTNTWRGINVDGTALLGTGTGTGNINFVSGTNVTLTGSGNDITISSNQVNADWNASSGVAQILNKPTIPTKTSDLTNDADFITANSPSLTGTPTSVTPSSGDDSTKIATTAYVQNELDNCVKYEEGEVSIGSADINILSTGYLKLTGSVSILATSTAKEDLLDELGLTYSSVTVSPESGATVETGGAYRLGPIVVFNVVFKLTKSFANGAKICGIPTQNTESRFMAYTGTDAWFAGKAMMPCRFHGSALKPIGATPTASSTNPIYLYVNQTYITSAS